MIKHLLTEYKDKVLVDALMMDEWTPFFYSAVNGYLISVDLLAKEFCCNINHIDRFQRTALHWAARYNNRAMAKKLIDLGIDVEARDKEGLTALELAKQQNCYEAAQLISAAQQKILKERQQKEAREKEKERRAGAKSKNR